MKKLALALSLALSGLIMAGSAAATEPDGYIPHGMTIYGRLETAKSGCTVLMSQYVINLTHADTHLPDQGTADGASQADSHMYIQLGGEHCDAEENYSKIGLKFLGQADNIDGSTLANTSTGSNAASGIGIQLTDINNNILTPNVTVSKFLENANAGTNPTNLTASFPLYLTLVKLKNQGVKAGNVQTNMTVQIERL
ncbi:Fimbrial protein [compost metagenome]